MNEIKEFLRNGGRFTIQMEDHSHDVLIGLSNDESFCMPYIAKLEDVCVAMNELLNRSDS